MVHLLPGCVSNMDCSHYRTLCPLYAKLLMLFRRFMTSGVFTRISTHPASSSMQMEGTLNILTYDWLTSVQEQILSRDSAESILRIASSCTWLPSSGAVIR